MSAFKRENLIPYSFKSSKVLILFRSVRIFNCCSRIMVATFMGSALSTKTSSYSSTAALSPRIASCNIDFVIVAKKGLNIHPSSLDGTGKTTVIINFVIVGHKFSLKRLVELHSCRKNQRISLVLH